MSPNRKAGKFLGLPYDWRALSMSRVKQRMWNPDDQRLLPPKALGWGYTVNFYALARRIGLIRK
jgi:hypothetical protein